MTSPIMKRIINHMITVLYFARLRETLGMSSERIAMPASVRDVKGLRALLVARGGEWQQELAPSRPVRAAVNQAMAQGDTQVADGDEIAFFPPVTGG
jgi:molybdopterin synthase sulfur carrier subunit